MIFVVAMKVEVLHDVLVEPFSVSTMVANFIIAKRVYRSCPILFSKRVTLVDLEVDLFDIDVILSMDLLHSCFASLDCRIRVVN